MIQILKFLHMKPIPVFLRRGSVSSRYNKGGESQPRLFCSLSLSLKPYKKIKKKRLGVGPDLCPKLHY
jgi:hypothetical protein